MLGNSVFSNYLFLDAFFRENMIICVVNVAEKIRVLFDQNLIVQSMTTHVFWMGRL